MEIDVGNALAGGASPGVARESLDRLDARVATAYDRIETGRRRGEAGYAALNLPGETDLAPIRETLDGLPAAEDVLLVGIGGSALGAATVADALGGSADLHVLDHLDPVALSQTLEAIDLEQAVVHVVSKSGETTETLANALVVREVMEDAGVDWGARAFVTTGSSGPLRTLARNDGLPILEPPAPVPGRYSALSTMGLPTLGLLGLDLDELLAGGAAAVEDLSDSLFESSAFGYGAISYALAMRGISVNAMMPYVEGLETFAEWFAQLWAESLGKDELGQVPVRALGVTDQHSQLQLYRAGPRNVQVTFLTVQERRRSQTVPRNDVASEAGIGGTELDTIVDAELKATEASLAAARRPNVRIELQRLDERSMGRLLVEMQAACMLAGELFGIDPFDQPAVEWGKRATRGILRGAETPETAAIEEKRELRIPRR